MSSPGSRPAELPAGNPTGIPHSQAPDLACKIADQDTMVPPFITLYRCYRPAAVDRSRAYNVLIRILSGESRPRRFRVRLSKKTDYYSFPCSPPYKIGRARRATLSSGHTLSSQLAAYSTSRQDFPPAVQVGNLPVDVYHILSVVVFTLHHPAQCWPAPASLDPGRPRTIDST